MTNALAPHLMRSWTASLCPCHAAISMGLMPYLSFASISHRASMSNCMMSVLPLDEAQWIGARPYWNHNENTIFYIFAPRGFFWLQAIHRTKDVEQSAAVLKNNNTSRGKKQKNIRLREMRNGKNKRDMNFPWATRSCSVSFEKLWSGSKWWMLRKISILCSIGLNINSIELFLFRWCSIQFNFYLSKYNFVIKWIKYSMAQAIEKYEIHRDRKKYLSQFRIKRQFSLYFLSVLFWKNSSPINIINKKKLSVLLLEI